MERPSKQEVEKFLKCFDDLASYEGMQRMFRAVGLYRDDQIDEIQPVNHKVIGWIKQEFGIEDEVINIVLGSDD